MSKANTIKTIEKFNATAKTMNNDTINFNVLTDIIRVDKEGGTFVVHNGIQYVECWIDSIKMKLPLDKTKKI